MKVYGPKEYVSIAYMLALSSFPIETNAQVPLAFTTQQVDQGEAHYEESCARCHGTSLIGAREAPQLIADSFVRRWAGRPVSDLFSYMKKTMPPQNPGGISDAAYSSIIAYVLDAYGVLATAEPMPSTVGSLSKVPMPAKELLYSGLFNIGSGITPGVKLPDWPARENPLQKLSRVTDATLVNPPPESWPSWRRTLDAAGFSPLRQINDGNVSELEVAWTLALTAGPNAATPLVHDGVMFVRSYGDHVQALDAATGDELWHYQGESDYGSNSKKHIALYDDKLYLSTGDSRIIALQSRTGRVVWEWSARQEMQGYVYGGGPLVVEGMVLQGASVSGAGLVIGLDAFSGKLLWRFNTIAQPGLYGGDSWNGLPLERRSGGAVWTTGSYDAKRGLALFGPSATYDTLPLRDPVNLPGVTNTALFTNATIALEPKTGKLAWFYQHFPNDQWDLDWAFERQVIDLNIDGKYRRLILTAGKSAIFDAIDADTGRYVFSIDLGLQNLVTSIDPRNGTKQIDETLLPGTKDVVTVCPHVNGGKSWLPGSYDQQNRRLYVPLAESCMDMVRVRHRGLLGGIRWTLRPRPNSDGKYGRLQALDVDTRQTLWVERQRAPQTTGVLGTAGGVVFAGALDRWFSAYSAKTGNKLWRLRLSDVPTSSPISYSVNGEQYIAVVVGHGGIQSITFLPLVPEIRLPAGFSSAIWVFKLRNRAR